MREYDRPEIREFARQASIQESECYVNLPEGLATRYPRVEEAVQFARKMGYKKTGIVFCDGLRGEAETLTTILERRGFDVVKPRGGIIILDYMLDDDKAGPMEPALVHLTGGMSQVNPGCVNTGAEFCELLEKAGCVDMEVSEFIPGSLARITGRKPK